ncbi:trans-sulfuration enzyme family protein [Aurantiacibacter sp. D1-12]|uniref:trans-sulfuration enzyme family protein n=1 Tax=Aurantiacibacter sp. D1-12 TaxID=2993658 RepID=UPI00237D147F|nr:PLP-dependent transferase [Aurantiacibacter sp. D1-12]MDE1467741.1 PLP-dependent transferase [Aurantiacibacter sp. D1-12]
MLELDPLDELICLRSAEPLAECGGMVLPAIAQASIFRKEAMEELHRDLAIENRANVYSRGTNPTVRILENTLAELERGEACKCFASGMGAIGATLFGLLKAGDHVLFVNDTYGPTLELARRLQDFGVSHDQVFSPDLSAIAEAMRDETRVVFMESPGSALFQMLDIGAIAKLAREHGAISVIDNTVATPLLQKPIGQGVDLVIHSCSKYIGGHSDAVGGALIGSAELVERVFYNAYMLMGAIMQPLEAFLFLRGLMTLPTRIRRHHDDALAVAQHLHGHAAVAQVFHPLIGDDVQTVSGNWRGHSGLFAFELASGGFASAVEVANRLRLFGNAVSWGGAESLVITGHKNDPVERGDSAPRIPAGLLRLSIGFEGVDALVEDLDRALT